MKQIKAITQQSNHLANGSTQYEFGVVYEDGSASMPDNDNGYETQYEPGEFMYPDIYTSLIWSKS